MRDMLFSVPDSVFFVSIYVFLLIGIVISYKVVKSIITLRENNKLYVITFLYNSFNFYIIYDLLTVPPTVSSGNGNPFVPYLFFSALIYIVFCIAIFIEIMKIVKNCNAILKLSIVLTAVIIGAISLLFQSIFVSKIEMRLTHQMGFWWSWWKDIHLNSLYFNIYTFFIGICISILLSVWLTLLIKK